ncbi:MAG: hypothetical protein MJZ85_11275 [Bacteroidales bacterium]|nr:hypothetical protein [Bacteroidales bacterium]
MKINLPGGGKYLDGINREPIIVVRDHRHDYVLRRADGTGKSAMIIDAPHRLYINKFDITISYPDGNYLNVAIIDHGNGKMTLRTECDSLDILSTYDELLEALTK